MVDAIASPSLPTAPTGPGTGFSAAGTGADFQTFLTMLTAQLKNQDPLNPMQGTDFAIQLATFAGVEQQALSNRFLEQMAGQAGGSGIAAWIGKEARTTAPVWFGEAPLTLDIAPHEQADSVQLVTRDAGGREVAREEIGPGKGQIDWRGLDPKGAKLPDGLYGFTLESRRGDELLADTRVGAYARIVEAEFGNGGRLVFEGGSSAPASEVTALRDPA
ncbi:flagellar basal body rod modification protein [Paracoccus gahaiensis]|uniref:Basal-body rod modification protein FlgD n=1 Tax=Paracoccus gahaiensis TaxID=1706839 RepID=A0A4U0RC24_9RHOB|nr:flagellar hook capping FlgD N-terminal domain-containing protein [Paracoccus gahaiensis]TJZ92486.1 flagellar basal body rod modification protein [Paracoccus gahaiensis]